MRNWLYILILIIEFVFDKSLIANPVAKEGFIDISGTNINKNDIVNLKGEWAFYWENFNDSGFDKTKEYIDVPGLWNDKVIKGNKIGAKGYATYKLKVVVGNNKGFLALKLINAATSVELFVNDKNIGSIGLPGVNKKESEPSYQPSVFSFYCITDTIIITAKVSNYEHKKGGLWEPIKIGSFYALNKERDKELFIDFFLAGAILIMTLYHFALYLMRRNARYNLFFSLFCFFLFLRLTVTSGYIIYYFNLLNWESIVRLEYISFYFAAPLFTLFLYSLFPRDFNRYVAHVFMLMGILLSIIVVLLPTTIFTHTMLWFQLIATILSIYAFWVLARSIIKKRKFAIIIMVGWLILFSCFINDTLYQNEQIYTGNYSYWGLLCFIIIMSLVVSKRFSNALNNLEKARKDLDYINKGLEISIEARTLEVLLQKERIEAQNRDMLSSINYASRIQTTILPDRSLLNSFFDSHYIIHLPKDIVSGDFYWLREYNNKIFIALADCTGHGIPGAFMSFLGHSLLNEAFIRFTSLNDMTHLLQPNIIMNYLRTRIKESLKQTGDTGEVSDGMDLGFCIYDKNTSDIKFSGANIPLVIIRKRTDTIEAELSSNKIEVFRIDSNREMLYVKPDRMPLGIYVNEVSFTNYNIHIEKGDQLYIFTDGFEDQMGGEKDKKFSRSRLLQLIRSIAGESNNDQYNQLMDVFMDWKSAANQEQIDDVSFIGLKV